MSTDRDWHAFNKAWRNLDAEMKFDRALKFMISTISAPKKFWWGIFFGGLIGVLLLAPESNFSSRVRDFFYTLQYSFVAWLEQSPENSWQVAGPALPGLLMIGVMIGYLRAKSVRWQELFIKAFVPLLTATLALYGTVILDIGGWTK